MLFLKKLKYQNLRNILQVFFKLATNYDTFDLPEQKRNFIFESDFRMRLQQGNIVTLQINRVQIRYIFQGEKRNLKIINFVGSFFNSFNQFIDQITVTATLGRQYSAVIFQIFRDKNIQGIDW